MKSPAQLKRMREMFEEGIPYPLIKKVFRLSGSSTYWRKRCGACSASENRDRVSEMILEDIRGGMTVNEVVQKRDVCRGTVYNLCKEHGIKPTRSYTRSVSNVQKDQRLLDLYNSGKTVREIADLYGVSHQAIGQRLNRIPGYVPNRSRYFPIPTREELLALIEQGKKSPEIVSILHISQKKLSRLLSEYQLSIPRQAAVNKIEIDDELLQKTLYESDNLQEAAKSLGISVMTLHRIRKSKAEITHPIIDQLQNILDALTQINRLVKIKG